MILPEALRVCQLGNLKLALSRAALIEGGICVVLVGIFKELLKVVQVDFFTLFRLLEVHVPQNLNSPIFDEIDRAARTALHADQSVFGELLQLSLGRQDQNDVRWQVVHEG